MMFEPEKTTPVHVTEKSMLVLSWLTARGSSTSSVCFSTDTLSPATQYSETHAQNCLAWRSTSEDCKTPLHHRLLSARAVQSVPGLIILLKRQQSPLAGIFLTIFGHRQRWIISAPEKPSATIWCYHRDGSHITIKDVKNSQISDRVIV